MEGAIKIMCTFAVVLLATVDRADTIQCYSCISGIGSGCDDPFDPSGSGVSKINTDAGEECQSCNKVKGEYAGISAVVRSCSTSEISKDDCLSSSGSSVCHCKGNLCNGAPHHVTSVRATIVICGILSSFKFLV